MAFLGNNDESVQVMIGTVSDLKGVADTVKGLNGLGDTAKDVNDKSADMSKQWGDNMKKIGAATAVVGAGLTLYAKSATDYAVGYVKDAKSISRITGENVTTASELIAVGKRLGISSDQLGVTFGVLSKKINEANNNTEKNKLAHEALLLQVEKTRHELDASNKVITAGKDKNGDMALKVKELNLNLKSLEDQLQSTTNPLDQLGISTQDSTGKTKGFNDILMQVSDKFKAMPDGATKTSLAMELFGRSGKDMIKVLNLGSDGIKDLEDKAKAMGLTLSTKNVAQIGDYVRSTKDLKEKTDELKLAVGLATTPTLTAFNNKVNEMVQSLLSSNPVIKQATVDVLAFGGPIFTATGAVMNLVGNLVTSWPAIEGTGMKIREAAAAFATLNTAVALVSFGAITLAASAAALVIIDAANRAKAAWDGASHAASVAGNAQDDAIRKINASSLSPAAKAAKIRGISGYADGTDYAPGGVALVGENGPELVTLPRGASVTPNKQTQQMLQNNKNITIGQVVITNESAGRGFWEKLDNDSLLVSKGLSPMRAG